MFLGRAPVGWGLDNTRFDAVPSLMASKLHCANKYIYQIPADGDPLRFDQT